MYTENGLLVDLGEIREIVTNADVFTGAFRLFPERLLVDTRHDPTDASGECSTPMVAIVDPVASVQERFFWLGQHRPSLGMPAKFMFFYWPHSIRFLEESGIWEAVRERVAGIGFDGARQTCDDAIADLKVRERAVEAAAIRGVRFQTLWASRA